MRYLIFVGFLTRWGSLGDGNGQFTNAVGIGADALGHIYEVDRGADRIEMFDSNGKFITAWGSNGEGNGQLNQACDIAVYPCGNKLYVTDRNNNNTIQMFDSNDSFLRKGGSFGVSNGQFNIFDVTVGLAGKVYVSDYGNNNVQVLAII